MRLPPFLSRFAVLSLLCVLALAGGMGFALSWLLTRAVSDWEWENTAAFARRQIELAGLEAFFTEPADPAVRERGGAQLARLFAGLPEVVRVKAWSRDATVLWSDEAQLIGRRFPDNDELREALEGHVAVEITEPSKTENAYERAASTLAEVYVPIRSSRTGEVVGVVEVYKIPVRLAAAIRRARLVIWGISLLGGLALYGAILPLVRQVYGRQVRAEALAAHASRLESEVEARTADVRRQAEELVQARKMEAVGLLAGGIAHDFNNLLTVILGRAELLRMSVGGRLGAQVEAIEETASHAAALTRQLLAFSRRQVVQPRLVDVNEVVGRVERVVRRFIGEDVVVTVTLDPSAGAAWIDPVQLEQVVLNLAVNGRDAMPQGGRLGIRTGVVDLGAPAGVPPPGLTAGRHVTLTVTDSGVGMDEATRARIFEPFFTTKALGKGTGLGLATVHGIVQQGGGRVTVQSEPGQGATFTVYLPQHDGVPEPERLPAGDKLPGGSETILLVEDEPAIRELAKEMLTRQGYAVLDALSGDDAIELARRHEGPIHLLLTDVVMPGVSGGTLAGRLQAERPHLAVLYTTGYADDAVVRHGVEGRAAFLTKPFTTEELARKVRSTLDDDSRLNRRAPPG
jgi:signal transduction histidine kinase/ActR/RegA family two-component response regulator